MKPSAPIAVGAVGGSGTRVVARALQVLDVHLGRWLNGALDNLVFTALIKTPSISGPLDHDELVARLRLFAAYESGRPLGPAARLRLARAAAAPTVDEHPPSFALAAARRTRPAAWGWKEPNTQLVLDAAVDAVAGLRYVHLLRHGLDMAFSANDAQLRNFGPRLGVSVPEDPARLPEARLDFWIASTEAALAICQRRLGDRHLVCRFDELAAHPDREMTRLASFVTGSEPDAATVANLSSLVAPPAEQPRYRSHDLSVLRSDQLDAVRALGFAIVAD